MGCAISCCCCFAGVSQLHTGKFGLGNKSGCGTYVPQSYLHTHTQVFCGKESFGKNCTGKWGMKTVTCITLRHANKSG